jgi:tetratricopeptide (TPR) repeat protein
MSSAPAASLELLEGSDRPDLLGEALLRMAMIYHRRGQLDESITMSLQAMEIARRANNHFSLVYAHQGLGISFSQTRHYKEALEHYAQMRDQARLAHAKMLEAYATLGIGTTTATLGDLHTGESLIREAIGMFRAVGAPFGLNHALYSLADFYRNQGRHAEALPLFREVAYIYEKYPNKIGLWYTLMAISREHMALGNRSAALAAAERAFGLAKEIGHSLYLVDNAQQIAAIHAANGDHKQA